MIALPPPAEDTAPREVTYHGVESVGASLVLAANEGRSYLDAVDVASGRLVARHRDAISQPCCVERIPGSTPTRALVSNLDGSLTIVEVAGDGALRTVGNVKVGRAPKRVAFLP